MPKKTRRVNTPTFDREPESHLMGLRITLSMNTIRRERFLYEMIGRLSLIYRYNLYQIKHIYIVGIIDLGYIG